MKKSIIVVFLLGVMMSASVQAIAQEMSVDMLGAMGDSIKRISERRTDRESHTVTFVYLVKHKDVVECYFGIECYMIACSWPPSFYFYNDIGMPVLVYTGFEEDIKFSEKYKDAVNAAISEWLYPDARMNVHYAVWLCTFRDSKFISFEKRPSRSKRKQFTLLRRRLFKSTVNKDL